MDEPPDDEPAEESEDELLEPESFDELDDSLVELPESPEDLADADADAFEESRLSLR